jgi:hypothetical protein
MPKWKRGAPDPAPARDRERERHALDIHDNIVQGLAEAQMAFEVGRPEQARDAVNRTLVAARRLVTELLGEPEPGDLRRDTVADQPVSD